MKWLTIKYMHVVLLLMKNNSNTFIKKKRHVMPNIEVDINHCD